MYKLSRFEYMNTKSMQNLQTFLYTCNNIFSVYTQIIQAQTKHSLWNVSKPQRNFFHMKRVHNLHVMRCENSEASGSLNVELLFRAQMISSKSQKVSFVLLSP